MTFTEQVGTIAERLIEDDTVAVFDDSNSGQAAARAAADLILGWESYDEPYKLAHAHEYQPHDLEEVVAQLQAWEAKGYPRPAEGVTVAPSTPPFDYVVVQQGGSTQEFYASTYATEKDAQKAIRSHERASYHAVGPFKIPRLNDEQRMLVQEAIEEACAATVGL